MYIYHASNDFFVAVQNEGIISIHIYTNVGMRAHGKLLSSWRKKNEDIETRKKEITYSVRQKSVYPVFLWFYK